MNDPVAAYSQRSADYVEALGSIEQMDDDDVALITEWARSATEPLLDAGCGPGHWTDYLRRCGVEAQGVDGCEEFVASARRRFPETQFGLADLRELPFPDASFGALLAWYSVIHCERPYAEAAIAEFARVLRPGGSLLIGVFAGDDGQTLDHAVTMGYLWSRSGLVAALADAGFEVLHVRRHRADNGREHLAISALKATAEEDS